MMSGGCWRRADRQSWVLLNDQSQFYLECDNITASVFGKGTVIMAEAQERILRVGVIGAGEVAQVIHLPVLSLLSHLFTTTIICDISKQVRLSMYEPYSTRN